MKFKHEMPFEVWEALEELVRAERDAALKQVLHSARNGEISEVKKAIGKYDGLDVAHRIVIGD